MKFFCRNKLQKFTNFIIQANSRMSNTKQTSNADGSGTFYDFITLCKEIEKEPSYNNKTNIVKTFIKNHDKLDLYLLCKLLCCKDDKRVFNMKEKQLVKVLSRIWKSNHADMIADLSNGDFTETAKKFFEESETSAKRSTITLKEVDTWLEELTKITKEDDQVHHFSKFLPKCTSIDLKFICKLMAHDLKINIGSKFVLNALHPKAFDAYTHSHNLKKVIEKVQKQELDDEENNNNNDDDDEEEGGKGKKKKPALKKGFSVGTSVMSPIKPMLAKPCDGAEECVKRCKNGMYVEIKYDGERVQLHKNGDELAFYSRNLKPVKEDKVEEVREAIPQAVEAESIILDGEILLMDTVKHEPLPFGTIGKNKKKKFTNATICFFAFDILYLNGESLIETPLDKRKKLLAENVKVIQDRIEIGEYVEATKAEEVDKEMLRVMAAGLEGLVIKDTKGIYKPNMRHWLKLKKDYLEGGAMADSVDLVVVGLYYGKGNKAGLLSTFLMATFDEASGQWKTVCKAGSGFDLKTLKDIQNKFDLEKIERQASKLPYWLDCDSTLVPDHVVKDPLKSFVFEIRGTSFSRSIKHTANAVSIRFPRIVKIRDDKDPENATNLKEFDLIVSKSIIVDSDPKEEEQQGEEEDAEENGDDDDDDEPKEKKKTPAKTKVAATPAAPKNQPKITAFAKNNNSNTNTNTNNTNANSTNTKAVASKANTIAHDDDEEMAEAGDSGTITKVEGDVTRPQVHQANEARAIMHIVDNSGKWPQRGVFGAISRAYPEPEKTYTSTATLKLGSIVTSKVSNTQDEGKLFVLSLVCQNQTKNGIPPFDMKAFEQCLFGVKSLADYKKITSVHVPRFDAAIPNMDWKLVERKLNETLTSHGIAVYVYEFGSKSPVKAVNNNSANNASAKKVTGVKRPLDDEDHSDEPPQKKAKLDVTPAKAVKPSNKKKELFSNVHVMFYGSCDNDKDLLSGAIQADGGDVMKEDDDFTVATHLVTDDEWDGMIDACLTTNPRLKVVHSKWLLDSIENGQVLDVKKYFVKKPAK